MLFELILLIAIEGHPTVMKSLGEYPLMDLCFEEREKVVETIGRPIVNYQAICIIKGDLSDAI